MLESELISSSSPSLLAGLVRPSRYVFLVLSKVGVIPLNLSCPYKLLTDITSCSTHLHSHCSSLLLSVLSRLWVHFLIL